MTKPAWLIGNTAAGIQDLVASLEVIASGHALDADAATRFSVAVATGPAPSAAVPAATAVVTDIGDALVAIYNRVPDVVSGVAGVDPSLAPAILATARAIGAAMAADDAVTAFAGAVDATSDAPAAPTLAANRLVDAANAQLVARLTRLVLMVPYAEALVRVTYASRQDGITARADCVERFERELGACQGAPDAPVAAVLTGLRDRCVEYLSRAIATLAPVVPVGAPVALPSLFWAWRLYGDPTRAVELMARNGVPHPSFMPTDFEALAPQTRFSGQQS